MAEYIDLEAFKKSVEERYCKQCKEEGKDYNGCLCRACWVDDMLDEVECFQPSDVAPVVHGRWVEHLDEMECSVCKRQWNYCDNDTNTFNFCPNCGAKMDGGDENV